MHRVEANCFPRHSIVMRWSVKVHQFVEKKTYEFCMRAATDVSFWYGGFARASSAVAASKCWRYCGPLVQVLPCLRQILPICAGALGDCL